MSSNLVISPTPPGGAHHVQIGSRTSRNSRRHAEDPAQTTKKSWYILAGSAALSFVVVSATLMYSKILAIALTALALVSVFFTVVSYGAYNSHPKSRRDYVDDLTHASDASITFLQQLANKAITFVVDKVYLAQLP